MATIAPNNAHQQRTPAAAYQLQLFVAGASMRSQRAIAHVIALCERYLGGRYWLEIVDVYQQPERGAAAQIAVTPTLILLNPPPRRHFYGDLAANERLLAALGGEESVV